jgi:hypothetical protein
MCFIWLFNGFGVIERRVQPRRAKGDGKQTGRPPGVGCHDGLSKPKAGPFMRVMCFRSGVKDLTWLLTGDGPCRDGRHAGIVYSAHHLYDIPAGLCNWHPKAEDGGVVCRVQSNTLAELKIIKSKIASEVRGPKVAGRNELLKIGR